MDLGNAVLGRLVEAMGLLTEGFDLIPLYHALRRIRRVFCALLLRVFEPECLRDPHTGIPLCR